MTREQFDKELAALTPKQEAALETLAAGFLSDAEEPITAAVESAGRRPPGGPKAQSVVSQLGETAVQSLSRAIGGRSLPDSTMLHDLAKGVDAARASITRRLKSALQDLRVIEPRTPPLIEEPEPPFRICDEAYLTLRRMEGSESMLQYSLELRYFLNLGDPEKDREIQHYLQSQSFTHFLDT